MNCSWFDAGNVEHLKAYRYLEKTGCWPEGFLPADIDMPHNWQFILLAAMAAKWLEHKLDVFNESLFEQVCEKLEKTNKELQELKKVSLKIEVIGDNELGNKIHSVLQMLFPKVGG
jgi:hypothetical protein